MRNKYTKGDNIIAFAVIMQPLLIVVQYLMMDVLYVPSDEATKYRVILTAIPMTFAIVIGFSRRKILFLSAYAITVLLFVLTAALFPQNKEWILVQGTRFTLPVVLPSALCLFAMRDFEVLERMMYIISWIITFFVAVYVISYFSGKFIITEYNMSFSYACLLPLVVIYSHRKKIDYFASTFLFLSIIAIGARGAAVCFFVYFIYDLFQHRIHRIVILLLLVGGFLLLIPALTLWLESVGIHSRTLLMFMDGSMLTNQSNRDHLRYYYLGQLMDSPFVGIGLFGDRVYTSGSYCHNIILEICLNFGIVFGGLIVLFLVYKLIKFYKISSTSYRNKIVALFCAFVLSFFFSGSYLIDSGLSIMLGACGLMSKRQKSDECNRDFVESIVVN